MLRGIAAVALREGLNQLLQPLRGDRQVQAAQGGFQVKGGQFGQVDGHLAGINQVGEIHGIAVQAECVGKVHIQGAFIELERLLQGLLVDGEQGIHIEGILAVILAKGVASQHVYRGGPDLFLDNPAGSRLFHHMFRQGCGIGNAGAEHGGVGVFRGLHHTHHGEVFARLHQLEHVGCIVGFIPPYAIGLVVLVAVRRIDQFKGDAQEIFVRVGLLIFRQFH